MGANTEERAFADWFIVKREILWSYYEAAKNLAIIIRCKERGSTSSSAELEFKKYVCELYIKLRPKLKNDKKYKALDNYIMEGKKLSFKEWYSIYCDLQQFVEDIGITKIERKQLAPEECVMDGV